MINTEHDADGARREGIREACRAARLPATVADDLIRQDLTLVEAQHQVFDVLSKRDYFFRQLPPEFLDRVHIFLLEHRTGQLSINVHLGQIKNAEIKERLKASAVHGRDTVE